MWKEAFVAYFMAPSRNLPKATEKNKENICLKSRRPGIHTFSIAVGLHSNAVTQPIYATFPRRKAHVQLESVMG
jgi:hypothetical protein